MITACVSTETIISFIRVAFSVWEGEKGEGEGRSLQTLCMKKKSIATVEQTWNNRFVNEPGFVFVMTSLARSCP